LEKIEVCVEGLGTEELVYEGLKDFLVEIIINFAAKN
jgi:hypothetical protein